MRRSGLVVLGLAAASTLAACGGGSSSGGSPASATTAGSVGSGSTPAQDVQAAAQAALLTLRDLPAGWTSSPSDNAEDSAKFDAELADCLHVSPSLFGGESNGGVEVDSPNFTSPASGGGTFTETVTIQSATAIDAGVEAIKSPLLPRCFDSLAPGYFKEETAKAGAIAAEFGKVKSHSLDLPKLGQDSAGLAISIPVRLAQQKLTIYDDVVFIRHDDAVALVEFESSGAPFDRATGLSIAQKAADKLSATTIPSV